MATGDEEIMRNVSDQRTTTNNESLKRYLFVIYFYHWYPETKNIFFWKQENSIFYGYCCAKQSCSYYSTWELLQSVRKVISVYLPTGLFYSQDSGAENGKQRAKSRCLVTSRSTCKHDCWKKNTEILFITILNNWQRSWYLHTRGGQAIKVKMRTSLIAL